tara:strand:- start:214 stop:1068 length:855 start_codon:yes stop_codon:yes gene_type:complete
MRKLKDKLIIFGLTGFIAKNLIKLLKSKKCEYIAYGKVDLDLTNSLKSNIKLKEIDFTNATIVFLSAIRPKQGEELTVSIKNLSMIKNLIENINLKVINQFIYISSDAVYPFTQEVISEKTLTGPETLYGHMHCMREKYLSDIIPKEKLTIFRPCAIYGEGETIFSYGINGFIRQAFENKTISLFGKGEEMRDHIFVKDFVNMIFESYKKKIIGLFNVATGNSKSFYELAIFIIGNFKEKVNINYKPRKVIIKQRSFDILNTTYSFKKIKINSIESGITKMLKI